MLLLLDVPLASVFSAGAYSCFSTVKCIGRQLVARGCAHRGRGWGRALAGHLPWLSGTYLTGQSATAALQDMLLLSLHGLQSETKLMTHQTQTQP